MANSINKKSKKKVDEKDDVEVENKDGYSNDINAGVDGEPQTVTSSGTIENVPHTDNPALAGGNVVVSNEAGGLSMSSIGLGVLGLVGIGAAAGGGGGSSSSTTSASGWSKVSGWGEVNVLLALEEVTGTKYKDIAFSTKDTSWGIDRSDANDANYYGYTGKGVVIAIIDSGVDLNNADLIGSLSSLSYDFVNNDNNVMDDNGHGTEVSSLIFADNNGIGLTGAAYDATLMSLKVLDANGYATVENITKAIYYAVDNGANIINLSLGSQVRSDVKCLEALQYADNHGVLVVMAAGNEYYSEPTPPAIAAQSIDGAIAVGALGQYSNGNVYMANFSNEAGRDTPYGYVLAAGVDVEVYNLNGSIEHTSGTSFSSPLVAAEAAILLSANSTLSDENLVNIITSSAQYI